MKKVILKVTKEDLKKRLNIQDGKTPVAGVDFPLPKDGEDYILTDKDKKEIAKEIKVPIVEKKIETIIEKQPIITNEIKEVAVADTRLQIVEKINTGKKNDLKIQAKQIDGNLVTEDNLNRAISILDQRTQFLINKPSQSLTGYVPYTGATADVNLGAFSLTATGATLSGLTAGSILFAGAGGLISQDNANLFWDDTNNRLGIGTASPLYKLDVRGVTLAESGLGVNYSGGSAGPLITNTSGAVWSLGRNNGGTAVDSGTVVMKWATNSDYIQFPGTAGQYFGAANGAPYGQVMIQPTATTTVGLAVRGAASQSANLQEWQNSAGTVLSVVDENGFVGAGTATPGYPLTVNNTVSGTPAIIAQFQQSGSERFTIRYNTTSNDTSINFNQGNTITYEGASSTFLFSAGLTVPTTGKVGNNANSRYMQFNAPSGATSTPALLFFNSQGSNAGNPVYRFWDESTFGTVNSFAVGSGASYTELFTILNNGNVGIGTTSPAKKLDVVGDVKITPTGAAGAFNMYLNSSDYFIEAPTLGFNSTGATLKFSSTLSGETEIRFSNPSTDLVTIKSNGAAPYVQVNVKSAAASNFSQNYLNVTSNGGATGGIFSIDSAGGATFNDHGADADFRIEGDTISTLFVVDAGLDQIQFGNHTKFASVAGIATEGALWADSTQKALQTYVDGIEQTLSGAIFTSTANATVGNTLTEGTLLGTGVGTKTLPANFFVAGKTIRIKATGFLGTDAILPNTLNIRFKLGSTEIIATGAQTPTGALSDEVWELEVVCTCRTTGATGTVIAQSIFFFTDNLIADAWKMVDTTTDTIDTTASQAIDITADWDGVGAQADDTLTCTNVVIETLN